MSSSTSTVFWFSVYIIFNHVCFENPFFPRFIIFAIIKSALSLCIHCMYCLWYRLSMVFYLQSVLFLIHGLNLCKVQRMIIVKPTSSKSVPRAGYFIKCPWYNVHVSFFIFPSNGESQFMFVKPFIVFTFIYRTYTTSGTNTGRDPRGLCFCGLYIKFNIFV